ncbi:MAG: NERD domain-containing protein [Acidimicrobiales bacterium]
MLPSVIDETTPSPGERDLFNRFRDDPATDGWVVLHSLDIARHRRQVSGEADFVVIVPQKGVLFLEVKACHSLRRDDRGWYYGQSHRADRRGPFRQASEAMHSIREQVAERDPELARVLFFSAVVFPYISFSEQSPEWHPWQVVDAGQLRSQPVSSLILSILESARRLTASKPTARWFDSSSPAPLPQQVEAIAQILRPNFEAFESPRSRTSRLDEELKRYTDEQLLALDRMATNPRVLFDGPAGTGKTLLAIEAARRARAEGRRVLFVCFNRALAEWLAVETRSLKPEVECRTLHSQMMRVARLTSVDAADQGFWEATLPERAILALLENEAEPYDELIVDEAQDIARETYLDFLDLSLRGGLGAGRWRFFGDFERQAIYGTDNSDLRGQFAQRAPDHARYALRENCRNTPRIAGYAELLGGLRPGYRMIRRSDDHVDPTLRYYSGPGEQRTLLVEALEALRHEGFSSDSVAVLSMLGDGSCASQLTEPPWRERLQPLAARRPGAIPYCSVHAFKGLEAGAVVLTDVTTIGDELTTALFYVGVTRALHRLTVLAHESSRAGVINALLRTQTGTESV